MRRKGGRRRETVSEKEIDGQREKVKKEGEKRQRKTR